MRSRTEPYITKIPYYVRYLLFILLFLFVAVIIIYISEDSVFPCDNAARIFNDRILSEAVMNDNNCDKIRHTVVIDAGHGGEDGGAVSDTGICEKNINLDISKKLYGFLLLSDEDLLLTRSDDRLLYEPGQENRKKYYDITNRIKIVSGADNPILVSIHQNKFPIRKYSGFQVYCSKNNSESLIIGNIIQDNIRKYLQPENNRETKLAGKEIRLLDSLSVPAVLAECGFLSNEKETELLSSEEYRKKLAFVIFVSLIDYTK